MCNLGCCSVTGCAVLAITSADALVLLCPLNNRYKIKDSWNLLYNHQIHLVCHLHDAGSTLSLLFFFLLVPPWLNLKGLRLFF